MLLTVTVSQIRRIVDRVPDVDDDDEEVIAARKKLKFCKSKQHIWDDLQKHRNVDLPEIRDEIDRNRQEYVRAMSDCPAC